MASMGRIRCGALHRYGGMLLWQRTIRNCLADLFLPQDRLHESVLAGDRLSFAGCIAARFFLHYLETSFPFPHIPDTWSYCSLNLRRSLLHVVRNV